AVIITPAATVSGIMEQCGQKGVHSVVIISAGFGESGDEGSKMQSELIAIAKKYRMRIVGPNCMGIINTDPELRMNATFSTVYPPEGDVALATQSGALGLAILDFARNLNLGLSSFVSIGNRADVSSNDLMQYWEQDPATRVILLYMESFGNPRKFARIARSITPKKPIIAVKSGRTQAGSRAAASHTGALATTDVASSAVFRQTGMIRVDTLEELFDVANLIVHQPIPKGRRVCILTNGGGPGIMTADACADRDLEIPELSEKTHHELKKILKSSASLANPVDMTAEASADQYRQSLKLLCDDDSIDIVIVIFIPPILTRAEEVAAAIRDMAPEYRHRHKTLVAAFMGTRGVKIGTREKGYVPSFAYPESIATALYKVCNYGDWLKRPQGEIPELTGINKEKGIELISQNLALSDKRPV
ncbi:MAG: CoA-binding protein, partial [Chloroflexi bacterium]|nr:CoA-binding protein [Chloroflexota bacterium]